MNLSFSTPFYGRIAPTPSGYLHKGNIFNFLFTWLIVRKSGGRLRLRIDDLDQQRVRTAYLEDIFNVLDWLELDFEDGPQSLDSHFSTFSQLHRIPTYELAKEELYGRGILYPCICSRKSIFGRTGSNRYDGFCAKQEVHSPSAPFQWRIKLPNPSQVKWKDGKLTNPTVDLNQQMGDFVIWKKDDLPAYHLASVVDDQEVGINLIVRGEDLIESTAAQLHLAKLLGYTSFENCRFIHHPLLTKLDGQKLSKSAGARSESLLKDYKGKSGRKHLLKEFAQWMKIPAEDISTLQILLSRFTLKA